MKRSRFIRRLAGAASPGPASGAAASRWRASSRRSRDVPGIVVMRLNQIGYVGGRNRSAIE